MKLTTKNFITDTPKDREGINISYSAEKHLAEKLLAELPKGWKVKGGWSQILWDADVRYKILDEEKVVEYIYGQNLGYYTDAIVSEVSQKVRG